MNFIQDQPYLDEIKKKKCILEKNHYFSIWPRILSDKFYCYKKKFFLEFLKYIEKNKFSNLEIDARISMFAFLKKQFLILDKSFTIII